MDRLSKAMQTLVEQVRFSADARQGALAQIRSNTRAALDRYGRERRDMAQAARRRARGQIAEIRGAAGALRHSTRLVLGGVASDVRAAAQLWSHTPMGRDFPPPATTRVEEKPTAASKAASATSKPAAAPKEPERHAKPSESERVMGIVRAHEDGIRLVDIGNKLGVDWRGLIAVTKSLLEEGKVEKIDSLYYPVED
jgi:hypothetical protein